MMHELRRIRLAPVIATALLAVVFLTLPALMPARAAVTIQEVKSDSGVTAWLVEDYSVPIIAMRFAFRGGDTQDPAGKEGLVNLMTGLFDEGAGDLDSDAFQNRLDDAGAEMRFERRPRRASTARCACSPTRRTRRWSCCAWRSRSRASTRRRSTASAARSSPASSPMPAIPRRRRSSPGRRRSMATIPIRAQDEGTEQTLASITADDLKALHRRLFARDNLIVGVVGAIDAETLKKELDQLFGGLPEKAELTPVADVALKLGQEIDVPYDLPQTTLQLRLSRRGPQQARIFRRLSDEPHPGRRRFHVAAVRAKCARSAALPTASARGW